MKSTIWRPRTWNSLLSISEKLKCLKHHHHLYKRGGGQYQGGGWYPEGGWYQGGGRYQGGGQQEGGNHVKFWWLPCKRPPWPHPIEISKTTKRLQGKIKFCKYCTVMYDDIKYHINCDDTQYKKTDYWRELMSVSVEHHFVPTKRCLRPKSLTFLQL